MKADYYKEKLNLFVASGPVVHLYNTPIQFLQIASQNLDILKVILVDMFGMYNFLSPYDMESSFEAACSSFPLECEILKVAMSVDSSYFKKEFIGFVPSGAGWRNLFHYG